MEETWQVTDGEREGRKDRNGRLSCHLLRKRQEGGAEGDEEDEEVKEEENSERRGRRGMAIQSGTHFSESFRPHAKIH